MAERHGIEIDYCPTCRGVWLDRGELDKFIAQAEKQSERPSRREDDSDFVPAYSREHDGDRHDRERYDRERYDRERAYPHYGKRKESFLSRLFDFD
jgi:Zn-finger nucleic acid-binding protein